MLSDAMLLGGGRKAAYSIENALLFRGGQYLSRTPNVAGNRQKFTISAWVRRAQLGVLQQIYTASDGGPSGDSYFSFYFNASDQLCCGSWGTGWRATNALYRDTTAWLHVVCQVDTTTQTLNLYVNGQQVTSFAQYNAIAQDLQTAVNSTAFQQRWGAVLLSPPYCMVGYLAEPILVDGAALDASHFGEADPVTGSWRPKAVSGISFGTNGCYLGKPWNAASLGTDYSGNGNDWTPSGFAAWLVSNNTPTNVVATFNPLRSNNGASWLTLLDGNMVVSTSVSAMWYSAFSTLVVDKSYVEVTIQALGSYSEMVFGVGNAAAAPGNHIGSDANSVGFQSQNGYWRALPSTATLAGSASNLSNQDIVCIAINRALGKIWAGKNGTTWDITGGDPVAGTGGLDFSLIGDVFFGVSLVTTSDNAVVNFGNWAFSYTPPAGFKALSTANLPRPTIRRPKKQMGVVTWTGNGAERAIDVGLQPDFVWLKSRTQAASHRLLDSVRGAGKVLVSNGTVAEFDENGLTAFTANGFNLLHNTEYNEPGNTYVAWCWKAGGAAVANTDGSIASQVSVNQAAGFSIARYVGTFANATVGHGLGRAPAMMLVRPLSIVSNWYVYHQGVPGAASAPLYLNLGNTSGNDVTIWNSQLPDAQTFSVGVSGASNAQGVSHVAYCWSEIPGFSKFGSYTGNGSADGPFVHCGFRPRWVLIKCIDLEPTNWRLIDTARQDINGKTALLLPNTSDTEYTDAGNYDFDVVANGFKVRGTGGWVNGTGNHYIFAAFAEYPLGASRVTPATAR